MQLKRSMVCLDCEELFDRSRLGRCPACGSAAICPLSRWVKSMLCPDDGPQPAIAIQPRRIGWEGGHHAHP